MVRTIGVSLFVATGCAPDLTVYASRVVTPRVLAVRADPAEARPGREVQFTALVAAPGGTPRDATVRWASCLVPRPLSESTTVASRCFGEATEPDGGVALVPAGEGVRRAITIPSDACRRVGPQVPPAGPDGMRLRAPDPDFTGGWQLPVRVELEAGADRETLFTRYRIRCQPPDVPGSTAQAYASRYQDNRHPEILAVADISHGPAAALPFASQAAHPDMPDGGTATVEGDVVAMEVRWTPESAERYVLVDPATRALAERTEALTVEWFTDGGRFERDRTGASDVASRNVLRLDAGRRDPANVWVVLRDERGGVDWAALRVAPR